MVYQGHMRQHELVAVAGAIEPRPTNFDRSIVDRYADPADVVRKHGPEAHEEPAAKHEQIGHFAHLIARIVAMVPDDGDANAALLRQAPRMDEVFEDIGRDAPRSAARTPDTPTQDFLHVADGPKPKGSASSFHTARRHRHRTAIMRRAFRRSRGGGHADAPRPSSPVSNCAARNTGR